MIRLQCPHCDKTLGVKDELAGRIGLCPQCKNKFRIPQPDAAADDEPSEERVSAVPRTESRSLPKKAPRRIETDDEESDEPPDERISAAPKRGARAQPDKPRRRPVEDDEEVEEPVRPRRRRDEDEPEDEDEPVRRSVVKRKKKKRRRASGGFSVLDPYLMTLAVLGLVGVVAGVLTLIWPAFWFATLALGWLAAAVGGIWLLVIAFQDSPIQGLLCLFVPFGLYALYYIITHFDETKKPFFLQLTGTVILVVGFVAGGISASRQIDTSPQLPSRLRGEQQFQAFQPARPA
jgi:hypothetical protein